MIACMNAIGRGRNLRNRASEWDGRYYDYFLSRGMAGGWGEL
ncbi:MAG: hypothetical protein ACYDCG_01095 [Candidatus Acidiferrales bacterium]